MENEDEVGMILISQKTWDKIKDKFPSPIKSIFPTMGFMNSIPVRVSKLVGDDKIIPVPKRIIDVYKDLTSPAPKLLHKIPLWMEMMGIN